MKRFFIFAGLLATFCLFSCNKEKDLQVSTKSGELISDPLIGDIRCFPTAEALSIELSHVLSLDIEDLIKYEKTNNISTFGRQCDEVYCSIIEIDTLLDEIKVSRWINKFPNFLELTQNDEGEMYFLPKLSNNPLRYIVGANRIYQVGDSSLCKIFNTGMLYTSTENVAILATIEEEDLGNLTRTPDFLFVPSFSEDVSNRTTGNLGWNYTKSTTKNKDRLKVAVNGFSIIGLGKSIMYEVNVETRPYKKTLGIWYWCSRTITQNITIKVNVNGTNLAPYNDPYTGNSPQYHRIKKVANIPHSNFYISEVSGTAKTPSVNTLNL
jgi:hypothetical protein